MKFVRAAVGDRYVLEQLREHGWQLGAEGSGHILSLDRHSTGDGIVSALLVLAALKRSGKTLAQMLDGVTLFPQKLINVRMKPGADWKGSTSIRAAIDAAEAALAGSGRVLIRASGTGRAARDGRGAAGGRCGAPCGDDRRRGARGDDLTRAPGASGQTPARRCSGEPAHGAFGAP